MLPQQDTLEPGTDPKTLYLEVELMCSLRSQGDEGPCETFR